MKIYFHLNIEGFSNAYLIVNPEEKSALIIDPGKVTIKMIEQIEQEKYTLDAVLITHNHASHTMGLNTLQKIYTPKIYAADYEVAKNDTVVLKGDGIIKAAGLNVSYVGAWSYGGLDGIQNRFMPVYGRCFAGGTSRKHNQQLCKKNAYNEH